VELTLSSAIDATRPKGERLREAATSTTASCGKAPSPAVNSSHVAFSASGQSRHVFLRGTAAVLRGQTLLLT